MANKLDTIQIGGVVYDFQDKDTDNKISTHNTATDAHNDIRVSIADLKTQLENFLDVDDTTVDQLSEVLTLINNNKGTLESLTTTKINVSDIINNLTTNSSNKVLSAAQGVAIKALIDALQSELDAHETQLNSLPKIYVQTNEPTNPKDGDLWVDTDDAEQTVLAAVATSGSFNDLIDKPTYGIANITNLQSELNKKANDFSLELYNGTGGNPKPVKFMTVNYSTCGSENGVAIKVSMVSGHGNGSSYAFLQDAIFKVTHTGTVEVDNFKYYGASTGTYDSANRQYGDIFWVIDTTNKIVDFYCLMGQYARIQMTPYKRVTYSTGGTITQYTSAAVYSSGTKVWANNNEFAMLSDIPSLSNYALKSDIPSLSGYATQTWVQQQIAAIAIYNGSVS